MRSEARVNLIYCREAEELLGVLAEAIHRLVELHEKQFHVVVSGDSDSASLDALIHQANQQKCQAKYAYLQHLEIHGCSRSDAVGSSGF